MDILDIFWAFWGTYPYKISLWISKQLGKENNNFQSDWNSTIINKPDLTTYATITNVNNTPASLLNMMNINNTSITI
jgi:hypothetical protein